jgi:transposase
MREVTNGLMYVLSTGCQWRAIPKDLPPRSTVDHSHEEFPVKKSYQGDIGQSPMVFQIGT